MAAGYSTTANFGWTIPSTDDPVNTYDTWGECLNRTFNSIDSQTSVISDSVKSIDIARATVSTNIALPNATYTKIVWDNELFDSGDMYTTTGIFTADMTSTVLVNLGVTVEPRGGVRYFISAYRNGSIASYQIQRPWGLSYTAYQMETFSINCVTNTTLEFYYWQISGVNSTITSGNVTFIRIQE